MKNKQKTPETTLAGIGFMASVFGELMLRAANVKTEFKANDYKILELAKKPHDEIVKVFEKKYLPNVNIKPTNLQVVEKALIDMNNILHEVYKLNFKKESNNVILHSVLRNIDNAKIELKNLLISIIKK